jgi:hypothetical protein
MKLLGEDHYLFVDTVFSILKRREASHHDDSSKKSGVQFVGASILQPSAPHSVDEVANRWKKDILGSEDI